MGRDPLCQFNARVLYEVAMEKLVKPTVNCFSANVVQLAICLGMPKLYIMGHDNRVILRGRHTDVRQHTIGNYSVERLRFAMSGFPRWAGCGYSFFTVI